jgi:hypothetical protein
MYYVTCDIVPNQDISIWKWCWYGMIPVVQLLDRTPLAWNINDAKAGQTIKARGMASLYEKGARLKLKFYSLILAFPVEVMKVIYSTKLYLYNFQVISIYFF